MWSLPAPVALSSVLVQTALWVVMTHTELLTPAPRAITSRLMVHSLGR